MAIKAFLSFQYEDIAMVNLFRAQAKIESNDLEFADYSIKEPFDSVNGDYIRRSIREKIKLVTLTVCLYGVTTYTSPWVEWELNETLSQGKPIMGVCLYSDGRVKYYPSALERWPRMFWNQASIVGTMQNLAANYRKDVFNSRGYLQIVETLLSDRE